MRSLGLEFRTQKNYAAKDIDIYIPYYPDFLSHLMEQNGYQSISGHSFCKKNICVDFKLYQDLTNYLPIQIADIPLVHVKQHQFYVPNIDQFLSIYQSSLKDPRRKAKTSADQAKINDLLERKLS